MKTPSFVRSIAFCVAGLAAAALPSLSNAQSYPPAFKTTSTYAIGDQVQLNGNVLRATHAVAVGGFKYDDWELWEVRANSDVIIGVGQPFTNLTTAWAYVHNARVADGAYLHLYLSSAHGHFSETFSAPFSLDHSFGANISLMADGLSGNTLHFNASGFTLDSGHAFGTMSALTLTGTTGTGIQAVNGASIQNIINCSLSGFPVGVDAEQNASINLDSTVHLAGFVAAGAQAMGNGSIVISDGITITGNSATSINGLYEADGGYIKARYATITDCESGVRATEGGVVDVEYANIYANQFGLHTNMKAHIDCEYATFSGHTPMNAADDIFCALGSTVDGTNSNAATSNNSIGVGDGSFLYT